MKSCTRIKVRQFDFKNSLFFVDIKIDVHKMAIILKVFLDIL